MTKVTSSMTCSKDIAVCSLRGSWAKMCDHLARAMVPRLGMMAHRGKVMNRIHAGQPRHDAIIVRAAQKPDQMKKGTATRRCP
jgi:hypothetical protein